MATRAGQLGQLGEQWAQAEYVARGFTVIAQHVFNPFGKQMGEIDFVATRGEVIVFVEVKTRSVASSRFGTGFEAVTAAKQAKLIKTMHWFLQHHPEYRRFRPQIDVCVVVGSLLDMAPKSVTILANAVTGSTR
jgi:putative endonuclease